MRFLTPVIALILIMPVTASAEDVTKDNAGKIVGASDAHKEMGKQIDTIDKGFEPQEKSNFERVHEQIEKQEKAGNVGK